MIGGCHLLCQHKLWDHPCYHKAIDVSQDSGIWPQALILVIVASSMVPCHDWDLDYDSLFAGFLKWRYPRIIHFTRIFHCKPFILGYSHLRKTLYWLTSWGCNGVYIYIMYTVYNQSYSKVGLSTICIHMYIYIYICILIHM